MARAIKESQEQDKVTEELGEMYQMLVDGVMSKFRFKVNDDEDAKQMALITLIQKTNKIDPDKRPFSYCTTIVINSLKASFFKNKKDLALIDKIKVLWGKYYIDEGNMKEGEF